MDKNNIQIAHVTDRGGRPENQDAQCVKTLADNGHVAVVCDGLGGHVGGSVASAMAVRLFIEGIQSVPQLDAAGLRALVEGINRDIRADQISTPAHADMRTTLVALAIRDNQALWCYVGDSRFYWFRDGRVQFQTVDHSIAQAMVSEESTQQDVRHHPDRNRLARCLGNTDTLRVSVSSEPIQMQPGDAFLLCTDGFWEYVLEAEMLEDLSAAPDVQHWLDRMLVRHKTRVDGTHDNFTAVALRVQ